MRAEGQSDSRAGLEAQRRAIAAACTRRGWQPLELLEEAGRSAQDPQPPGGEEAPAQGGRRWYPATVRYTLSRAS